MTSFQSQRSEIDNLFKRALELVRTLREDQSVMKESLEDTESKIKQLDNAAKPRPSKQRGDKPFFNRAKSEQLLRNRRKSRIAVDAEKQLSTLKKTCYSPGCRCHEHRILPANQSIPVCYSQACRNLYPKPKLYRKKSGTELVECRKKRRQTIAVRVALSRQSSLKSIDSSHLSITDLLSYFHLNADEANNKRAAK